MIDESQVHMLHEMGFSNEQAVSALELTGNDVTRAIAYLFGEEEILVSDTPRAELSEMETNQTVQVSNPQEIPEFLNQGGSGEATETVAIESIYNNEYSSDYVDDISSMDNTSNGGKKSHVKKQDYTVSPKVVSEKDFGPNIKSEGHLFPVIVSTSDECQIMVSLLMVLSKYSPFVDALLEEKEAMGALRELQRIIYFVINFDRSKRWYINADKFFAEFNVDMVELDDEDVILNIYEQLMKLHPGLAHILRSWVESVEEEIVKDLTVLEIYNDTRRSTLYQSLNELFWQKNFSKVGDVKYKEIAPVVTFHLAADDGGFTTPFELEEFVYPEIYSDKGSSAVQKQVEKMESARGELEKVRRKTMDLTIFEGKHIDSLLRQTSRSIKSVDSGSAVDLTDLADQIWALRMKENETSKCLQEVALGSELEHYTTVIDGHNSLQRYSLIGVICFGHKSYMRAENKWVEIDERALVDFDAIRLEVKNLTRGALNAVTLIYGAARAQQIEDGAKTHDKFPQEFLIFNKEAAGNLETLTAEKPISKPIVTSKAPEDELLTAIAKTLAKRQDISTGRTALELEFLQDEHEAAQYI